MHPVIYRADALPVIYLTLALISNYVLLQSLYKSRYNYKFMGRNRLLAITFVWQLISGVSQMILIMYGIRLDVTCMIFEITFQLEEYLTFSNLIFINILFLGKLCHCVLFGEEKPRRRHGRSKSSQFRNVFILLGGVLVTGQGILSLYILSMSIQIFSFNSCWVSSPPSSILTPKLILFCYSFCVLLILNLILCTICLLANPFTLIVIDKSGQFYKLKQQLVVLTIQNITLVLICLPIYVFQQYSIEHKNSLISYWIYRSKIVLLPFISCWFPDLDHFKCGCSVLSNDDTYLTAIERTEEDDLLDLYRELGQFHYLDSRDIYEIVEKHKRESRQTGSSAIERISILRKSSHSLHIYENDDEDWLDELESEDNLDEYCEQTSIHTDITENIYEVVETKTPNNKKKSKYTDIQGIIREISINITRLINNRFKK
ncbi:uncharacterized protein LOC126817988 [Patella vulgata]|uniref:uncharacterized protein LOC126817988 n=1 Tax=Patella vulgata TaxID=6465 RepID=UPI0024A917EA|nr:uncharacterized protein LOC126817988 [Patella vulgata]